MPVYDRCICMTRSHSLSRRDIKYLRGLGKISQVSQKRSARGRTVIPSDERIPILVRNPPIDVLLRLLQGNVHIPIQAR